MRVFTAASSIGFVMGFAMFGALTFLPLFMQNVKGVSPTASGLRILPLMLGMLGASVTSGRLVTRWGRYRIFPIVGTALMTVGAYLLSLIDASTNGWVLAFYMFVFGVGMGLVMQVLVVAVQNAVSYEDLGVATSSADVLPHDRGLLRHGGVRRHLRHRLHPHVRADAGQGARRPC